MGRERAPTTDMRRRPGPPPSLADGLKGVGKHAGGIRPHCAPAARGNERLSLSPLGQRSKSQRLASPEPRVGGPAHPPRSVEGLGRKGGWGGCRGAVRSESEVSADHQLTCQGILDGRHVPPPSRVPAAPAGRAEFGPGPAATGPRLLSPASRTPAVALKSAEA